MKCWCVAAVFADREGNAATSLGVRVTHDVSEAVASVVADFYREHISAGMKFQNVTTGEISLEMLKAAVKRIEGDTKKPKLKVIEDSTNPAKSADVYSAANFSAIQHLAEHGKPANEC